MDFGEMTEEQKKENEGWVNKRRTIIDCCQLNSITPSDFLAIALGIIITEYKRNGRTVEDIGALFVSTLEEARTNWEKI